MRSLLRRLGIMFARPGDVIVLTVPALISARELEILRTQVAKATDRSPDVQVLVVHEELRPRITRGGRT